MASTLVESGEGRAIVAAVGKHTRAGRAERIMDIENELTPLQKKLETIANQIGTFGVYVAVLTFIALIVRLIVDITVSEDREFLQKENLSAALDALVLALSIIVCAVPEGLPLAVTIALAFSVSKMFQEHNLVRKLHASETMGGANEICTDKTGTLTQNKMTVQAVFVEDNIVKGDSDASLKNNEHLRDIFAESVLFNCSAFVESEGSNKVAKGNVTEVGLINYLLKSDVDAQNILAQKDEAGF